MLDTDLTFNVAGGYLLDQKDMYKFMTLLPKDYCLIPGNGAIKLVDRI